MIKNFTFQSPTKIIFGKGAVGALKREIPKDKCCWGLKKRNPQRQKNSASLWLPKLKKIWSL